MCVCVGVESRRVGFLRPQNGQDGALRLRGSSRRRFVATKCRQTVCAWPQSLKQEGKHNTTRRAHTALRWKSHGELSKRFPAVARHGLLRTAVVGRPGSSRLGSSHDSFSLPPSSSSIPQPLPLQRLPPPPHPSRLAGRSLTWQLV